MAAKGNVDSQLLAALSHAGEPGDIQYREDMRGKLDKIAIAKHTRLLIELREHNSYVNQKDLELAFRTLAENNEKDWHLADEKNAYAKRSATRVRVMLRDVAQNALKYKARKNTQHGWHLLWNLSHQQLQLRLATMKNWMGNPWDQRMSVVKVWRCVTMLLLHSAGMKR